MSRKEKQRLTPLYFAISLVVLVFVVVTLVFWFMNTNNERINEQNKQYLEDAASQTVIRIDEVFENASTSIVMVSRLYELQLKKPEFDYHLLGEMTEPTPFDYIRFIDMNGTSWSGDGTTTDSTDRDYYTEGIKGNSGIYFVPESRFTHEPLLAFYTPLYYEDEIIGVVNGLIRVDKLARSLETTFFGVHSNICIALPDARIIMAAWNDDFLAGVQERDFLKKLSLTDDRLKEIIDIVRDGGAYSFRYTTGVGEGAAYIEQIAGGEFYMIQNFPSAIGEAITARANGDAMKLEIALVAVFAVYIIITVLYYIRINRSIKDERDDLSQIVDSVKGLYRRFVVLDLYHNTYEYLEEGDISDTMGISNSGKYSEWFELFRKKNADDPRYWGDMQDMTVEHLQATITKEDWHSSREYPTPDGHWERLSLIKLDMDSDVTYRILGAVEDITESKKRDEESRMALEAAFRAAETASQAKSDFLSRMSHDIRTPMNAIIGLTAIMGAHLDDRDKIIDSLSKITYSSKHLLGLINEVLDMSKIESGKLVLSEDEFSLCDLVDDTMSIVQPSANAKHQNLTVHILGIEHENVIGDCIRIQQVCVNILSNSVKYTEENGDITLYIKENKSKSPSFAEFEFIFEDNGIGMSEEFLQKICTPFERAEDERISGVQGTGLGMSIAQSIIRLMGGTLSVESVLGKGSKFTVTLKLRLQDPRDEVSPARLIGLPVLVADDDQVACETTCLMLGELGMDGEWVLTGREAVDSVKAHRADKDDFFAVILDWKMPDMDGVETARAIRREIGDDIPIIILSAYDWSEIEDEARAAGVNSFIGKPLFKSRLRSLFENLVSDSDRKQESSHPLEAIQQRDFSGKRALLVEDNDLNQEIAKEILEMTGLSVEIAENGKVAVEMFERAEKGYYNIVFMDIQMPIMNGYESTRAIRALDREDAKAVPIVAMSANTFSEDVQESLNSGMVEHIGKPINMEQLAGVLDKWMG